MSGGPLYTFELLEEQLKNGVSMMSDENPINLMFSAILTENNETVGHIQLLGIDRINMSTHCRALSIV